MSFAIQLTLMCRLHGMEGCNCTSSYYFAVEWNDYQRAVLAKVKRRGGELQIDFVPGLVDSKAHRTPVVLDKRYRCTAPNYLSIESQNGTSGIAQERQRR